MRSISLISPSANPGLNTLAPTTSTVATTTTTPSPPTNFVPSPWHSPIPYLFGGLAVIMAFIAVAMFILACSYWRLTRRSIQQEDLLENNNYNNNNNVVKEGDDDSQNKEHTKVYEENVLVIMAGDHKPTFLATPSCSHGVALNFEEHL